MRDAPSMHSAPESSDAADLDSASAGRETAGAGESDPTGELNLVKVGFVFRPHGVQGELKIKPETPNPEQFEAFDRVWVGSGPDTCTVYSIASVRYQQTKRGTTVILQLDDIASRDAAETITKQSVFVPEEALVIDDDEVLLHDLIDVTVQVASGEAIGVVTDILEHPAHLTLVIRRHDGPETMLPFVDDFVRDVDVEAGTLTVDLIDGLAE